MVHETDIKINLKMNVVCDKNLRKPRIPYQLTPVYGTPRASTTLDLLLIKEPSGIPGFLTVCMLVINWFLLTVIFLWHPLQGRSQGVRRKRCTPFGFSGPACRRPARVKTPAEATETLTEVTTSVRKPTKSTSGQSGPLWPSGPARKTGPCDCQGPQWQPKSSSVIILKIRSWGEWGSTALWGTPPT